MSTQSELHYVREAVGRTGQEVISPFSLLWSNTGKRIKHPLRFTVLCQHGHANVRSYQDVRNDPRCTDCYNLKSKRWIQPDDAIAVVRSRGWTYVGVVDTPENHAKRYSKKKITVRCEHGHQHDIRFEYIKGGQPCRTCAGRDRWDLPSFIRQIEDRPFTCTSHPSELKNNKSLLCFECKTCRNEWTASVVNVVFRNSGCPTCPNKGQAMVTKILNTLFTPFGYLFATGKLRESRDQKGRHFVYDLVCRALRLVIEYDGDHHRGPIPDWGIFDEQYRAIVLKDRMRDADAAANGFTMIRIPSLGKNEFFDEEKMFRHILPIILNQLRAKAPALYRMFSGYTDMPFSYWAAFARTCVPAPSVLADGVKSDSNVVSIWSRKRRQSPGKPESLNRRSTDIACG